MVTIGNSQKVPFPQHLCTCSEDHWKKVLEHTKIWNTPTWINMQVFNVHFMQEFSEQAKIYLNCFKNSDTSTPYYILVLTLKMPRKYSTDIYVVCWIFLQTYQTCFCIHANSVDPDQTAPRGAVWSRSTLFAKITFKITSRWQSRRQLLWLAVKGLKWEQVHLTT